MALHDYELIEITTMDNAYYIKHTALKDLEKMTRLHFELDTSIEEGDRVLQLLANLAPAAAEPPGGKA